MINNKIKIPWYKRNIGKNRIEANEIPTITSPNTSIPKSLPLIRNPVTQPVPQIITEPVPQVITEPVLIPQPEIQPNPLPFTNPEIAPNPLPFPLPFPLPMPAPKENTPSIPNLPPLPAPSPLNTKTNPFSKLFGNVLKPIIYLLVAREIIKINIGDPIYNKMLLDPVLGMVLRESEKANFDMGLIATYFANYDWDNLNIEQMTKELTTMVGIAGATRIITLIVGRKILFRM